MNYFKLIVLVIFLISVNYVLAQQNLTYTTKNAHSHNDYENTSPFVTAHENGFGSIEADIFYFKDSLFVGHVFGDVAKKRTLEALYLEPLSRKISNNYNYPYQDSTKDLQILIDIKTDPYITLNKLIEVLNSYPSIIHSKRIKIVITGNRPKPLEFVSYPNYIYFDGDIDKVYTEAELSKIGLFSADFTRYSIWNGKGIMVKEERQRIDSIIKNVHDQNKKIRFWASPDYINAWQQFIKMKVDFINTDHIVELAKFLNNWQSNNTTIPLQQKSYLPKYENDGVNKPVKKIILLIGDGCSLPQWYAGYTANGGSLTTFFLKHIGFSKTSSADNYVTDSAPGASSLATGEKIENRHLGLNPKGEKLNLITDFLSDKKFSVGLISSGDVSDATPAAFYSHIKERDSSTQIISQLNKSNVQILAGAGNEKINSISILQKKSTQILNNSTIDFLLPNYEIKNNINNLDIKTNKKTLVIDYKAGESMQEGRGAWLSTAFEKISTTLLNNVSKKYFLMVEAAQIDYGGHANNLEYVVKEVIDFDVLVSKVIEYADNNKGTLVIITGDHETGGLTLLDGDYNTRYVSGQFATNDHTGIPVPVFAYGYRSYLFDGVYENTAIFDKIKLAINQ